MTPTTLGRYAANLTKKDWGSLVALVDAYCVARAENDWIEWGKSFQRAVSQALRNANASAMDVDITFPPDNLKVLMEIIAVSREGKDDAWITWSNNVVESIGNALKGIKKPAPPPPALGLVIAPLTPLDNEPQAVQHVPQQWEYCRLNIHYGRLEFITLGGVIESEVNSEYGDTKTVDSWIAQLGLAGWEIVGIVGEPGPYHQIYFKRPRVSS